MSDIQTPPRQLSMQEMAVALNSLSPISLHVREDGSWYVRQSGVELKQGGLLHSVGRSGESPHAAVVSTWSYVTKGDDDRYLVLDAMGSSRRAVRWNGFMWADIKEPK